MNWFARHLNWSALFIPLGNLVFAFLLFFISLGFYIFPNSVNEQVLLINNTLVFFTGSFILGLIGLGWVLRQKNRRLAFILFFIPISLWIILLIFRPEFLNNNNLFLVLIMGPSILAIIGWVWLLCLKKCLLSENTPGILQETSDSSFPSKLWVRKPCLHTATLLSAILIITAMVGFSGYSYYNMNHGYLVYEGHFITGNTRYSLNVR